MSSATTIQFGVYEADVRAGELRKHGLKVKLQAQPFGILVLLLERPGEIVDRSELRQKLWPTDVFVDFDQGLNKAVNKLRDALGDSAENPRFIETIPKRGYRFIAPVTVRGLPEASALVTETPLTTAPPANFKLSNVQPSEARTRNWRNYTAAIVLVAVIAVVAAGAAFFRNRLIPPTDSLAVLPLADSSSDANLEYLGDGITETIINNLSQLPGLRVMARSTVFHYKGKDVDPRVVGRELGVRAVLTGRVVQNGENLIISMELTNVADGTQLWGEHYNRKFADLLAVQDEISRQITSKLQLKLTGAQQKLLARRYTDETEAYQLYLRGRYYFNKRTDEGFLKAADYFQQAIARDESYGLAYAGLADCYGLLAWETYPAKEYLPKAKAAADKALQIDDQMAEAHTSKAMIKALYEWDWSGAEAEYQRAIKLNPGYATAHHWYGIHLAAMGRFEESRRELQNALDLDPLSVIVNLNNAYPYHYTHQYERAVEVYRKTIEMDPNFAWAHEDLMLAYEQQGKQREAIEEGVTTLRLSGDAELAAAVQRAYTAGGYRVALQRWIEGITEQSKSRYVPPIRFAQLYVRLGERDKAFEWLEKAYALRSAPLVYLNVDPRYDSLRSDPRFTELLGKIGLR